MASSAGRSTSEQGTCSAAGVWTAVGGAEEPAYRPAVSLLPSPPTATITAATAAAPTSASPTAAIHIGRRLRGPAPACEPGRPPAGDSASKRLITCRRAVV